jgi:putative DNA primase/helicase
MSQRDNEQLQGMDRQDGSGPDNLDGTPSRLESMASEAESTASLEEMAAAVRARADQITAQVPKTTEEKIKDLDLGFIRQCLSHNRVGDANLWVALFGDKYVWVREWETFLIWNGQHWEVDHKKASALSDIERVCETYEHMLVRLKDNADEDLIKSVRKRCSLLRDRPGRENLLACAISIYDPPVISQTKLDAQPHLLPTPTGVVDLRTAECAPGRQSQYLFNPCPTPWTGKDTPCPTFDKYLLDCMADDQEMAEFLVRLLGYGLLGEKHLAVWAIFFGPLSRNGKDTCMNTLKHVLGNRLHVRVNVQMLMEQRFARQSAQAEPDLMALRGARIAYASEASTKMALDQAKIKDMTGGGYITARGLQDKEMSEWKQSALMLMLTNYLPKLNADDDGFKARTICIEWPVKFVPNPTRPWERQIDYNIGKRLEAEASGILARLVRGCQDVLANGLRIPDRVLRYTQEQMDAQDDIGRFIRECCDVEEPPTGERTYQTKIPVSEFLKVCNWWCKKQLGNAYDYTPKKVTPLLEKKGIPTHKSSVMHYMGLSVLPDVMRDFQDDTTGKKEERTW